MGKPSPNGLLNINKPTGMTSREVVDWVERLAGRVKAGHAGTLDPLASGVLVVCLGRATRLIEFVQRMPKQYHGAFLLGRESPTEDVEGVVTELSDPPVPSREQVVAAAGRLVGWIEQRPPAFSALKVEGRRAYDLARRGKPVDLKPRLVYVNRIEVESYEYPELRLRIECGSGTYVRSLGRDLAVSLGTNAVMSGLERTLIGGFRIEDAVAPRRLNRENWLGHLIPPLRAVDALPRVDLTEAEAVEVRHGRLIARPVEANDAREFAAVDLAGRLAAILVARGRGQLGPTRNLLEEG